MTGALPTPRLREAHAHILAHGQELSQLQLASCGSVGECLDRLRDAHAAMEPGRWLVAVGARTRAWREARWPTMNELARAVPGRACVVMSFDHHALAVNPEAFVACGLRDSTPDPPGGVIVRDEAGGATGLLLENAARIVRDRLPSPTPGERRACLLRALADLASHGFAEVHDLLSPPTLGPDLAALHDEGLLNMVVRLYPAMDDLDGALRGAREWQRPGLRLAGAKLFADGTLNSTTAHMLSPYREGLRDHPCGTALLSAQDVARALDRVRDAGLELAVHAIGDGAVRACLDGLETHRRAGGAAPLRIEHAEVIDEQDVARFAGLGAIASVQPCHLLYDVEALIRQLPHRLDRVLPLRELISCGLVPGRTLVFGSDVPIVRADPEDSILAATRRRRGSSPARDAIAPEQSITEREAWECFGV